MNSAKAMNSNIPLGESQTHKNHKLEKNSIYSCSSSLPYDNSLNGAQPQYYNQTLVYNTSSSWLNNCQYFNGCYEIDGWKGTNSSDVNSSNSQLYPSLPYDNSHLNESNPILNTGTYPLQSQGLLNNSVTPASNVFHRNDSEINCKYGSVTKKDNKFYKPSGMYIDSPNAMIGGMVDTQNFKPESDTLKIVQNRIFNNTTPNTEIKTVVKNVQSRINPIYIPRPDKSNCILTEPGGKHYETDKYINPPSSTESLTIIDKGNASSRFIRMTLNQIPIEKSVLNESHIPLASVIHPFPILGEFEERIPLINLNVKDKDLLKKEELSQNNEGPLKCPQCNGYVSQYMKFFHTDSAECNLCGNTFKLPIYYQEAVINGLYAQTEYGSESLEKDNNHLKGFQRPELLYGTVDYVAPPLLQKVYKKSSSKDVRNSSQSNNLNVCFAIENNMKSLRSGFTNTILLSLKSFLNVKSSLLNHRICIFFFNSKLLFYPRKQSFNNNNRQSSYQTLIMSNINDPFCPGSPDNFFFELPGDLVSLMDFIDHCIQVHQMKLEPNYKATDEELFSSDSICGNTALRVAVSLLMQKGSGIVQMFHYSKPNIGIGSYVNDNQIKKTEKSVQSYLTFGPCLKQFYDKVVDDCVKHGVCVDIFCHFSSNNYSLFGRMSYISRMTGGHSELYTSLDHPEEFKKIYFDISRRFQVSYGIDCFVKLRCSKGISITKCYASGSIGHSKSKMNNFVDPSTFRIPRIDSDTSFIFELAIPGKIMDTYTHFFIQFACLYKSIVGCYQLRISTLAVAFTNSLNLVFRHCDVETVFAYFIRNSMDQILSNHPDQWKNNIILKIVNILYAYRINCATTSSSGQLILPEGLKFLPVYVCGSFKHKALSSFSDPENDYIQYLFVKLMTLPLNQLLLWFYPKVYVFYSSHHLINKDHIQRIGLPTGVESQVYIPPTVPCSGERITTDGIYLVDNGLKYILYIGADVSKYHLENLFGNNQIDDILYNKITREHLSGFFGNIVNVVLDQIIENKGLPYVWQPLYLISAKSIYEKEFLNTLIEDQLEGEIDYVEFLCKLHRHVQNKIEDT